MQNDHKYLSWGILSVALFLIFFVVGFQIGQNPQKPILTTIQDKSTVGPSFPSATVHTEIEPSATYTPRITSTAPVTIMKLTDTPTVTLQPTLISNSLCVKITSQGSTMIGLLDLFNLEYNPKTSYYQCNLREVNNNKECTSIAELDRNIGDNSPILPLGAYIVFPGVTQQGCLDGGGEWVLDATHP